MRRELLWSAAAMAARTVTQLALAFAVVTRLSPENGGLWFLFASVGSVAQFFDMGMAAAVMRSASHFNAGAKTLQAQGVDRSQSLGEPNKEGLKTLLATTGVIYYILSLGVLVLAVGVGFTAFGGLTDEVGKLAWMLYAVGVVLQLMISQKYNFWQGAGRLIEAQKILFLGCLLSFGGAALALLVSSSLLWACGAFALGSLLQLLLYLPMGKLFCGGRVDFSLLGTLWPNCWRGGLSRLSYALLYYLPTLVVAQVLGVAAAGQYGFTVQVCLFIVAIAQLPMAAAMPRINELAAHGDLPVLRNVFFQKMRYMFILYAVMGVALVAVGPWLLELFHSKTSLLPLPLLIGAVLFFVCEIHRLNHVGLVWAFNHFPFWKFDILSGVSVLAGSFFALQLGALAGLVVWLWLVQLAWSFWWPVTQGLKVLKSSWGDYRRAVIGV